MTFIYNSLFLIIIILYLLAFTNQGLSSTIYLKTYLYIFLFIIKSNLHIFLVVAAQLFQLSCWEISSIYPSFCLIWSYIIINRIRFYFLYSQYLEFFTLLIGLLSFVIILAFLFLLLLLCFLWLSWNLILIFTELRLFAHLFILLKQFV